MIFTYKNYKHFLKTILDEKRGSRKELALHLNCQSGYISQVLQDLSEFSLEQGIKICSFLNLTEEESHFFMLLLQKEKAGNNELKKYFEEQISKIKNERNDIKKRLKIKTELNIEDYHQYYSSWEYAAVHILTSIPHFQTKEKIKSKLGLTTPRLNEVLDFLLNKGLIEEKNNKYTIGKVRIHISKDSPFIISHHKNWRQHSIYALSDKNAENVNYSGVFSIAKEDILKIKEIVLTAIEKSEAVIGPSKEEELIYLGFDLNIFK